MSNPFAGIPRGLESPASDLVPVTPSDATDLPQWARGFKVTTDGTLKVTTWDGADRTFAAGEFATGMIHGLCVRRVWATGTTMVLRVAL